jgi:membrane protease YdiL (CAAX protease family)
VRSNVRQPERELRIFGGYALFYILASYCTGLLIRRYPIPILGATSLTQDLWYDVLFKGILLLAVPYFIYRKLGYTLRDLPASLQPNVRTISILILSFLAGNIVNLKHIDWIGESLPNYSNSQTFWRMTVGAIGPLVTAGFPEEFVYRGILQTRMEAVWGRLAAVLGSTTLFTAWHIPTRYLLSHGIEGDAGNLSSVLIGTAALVFIFGLIFSVLWDRYRKFWPLVAGHWGVDFLPSVSSLFGVST